MGTYLAQIIIHPSHISFRVTSKNSGVIIMGATNRPFDLDDAILRRLGRRVLVDLPTESERLLILRKLLRDEVIADETILEKMAKETPFYSGSDLKQLCIATALACVRESLGSTDIMSLEKEDALTANSKHRRVLQTAHFEQARREVPASIAEETHTLTELRKWDEKFGEGAKNRKKKTFGF